MVGRCAGALGLGGPYHGGEVDTDTEHESIYIYNSYDLSLKELYIYTRYSLPELCAA